jgi:hypothetical protein
MKDFILFFWQPDYDYSKMSSKEMEVLANKWKDWIGGIAEKGKFSNNGPPLSFEGKVLKSGGGRYY